MTIYILIFFSLMIFSYIEILDSKQIKPLLFVLFCSFCLFLFFFTGFREIGFDYSNYQEAFKYLSSTYWSENGSILGYELLYSYLNYLLDNYTALVCLISFIIILVLFVTIFLFCPYYFIPLFCYNALFLYTFTMGQYRQMLAVTCVLLGLCFKRVRLIFVLFIIIGALFHTSAIVAFLYLFLRDRLYPAKIYILGFATAFVMNMSFKPILQQFMPFMPSYIAGKLDLYFFVEKYSLGLNFITFFRLFILYIAFKHSHKINIRYQYFFYNAYAIGLIYYIAFGFLPQLAGRGSIYFTITEMFVISNLLFSLPIFKRYLYLSIYVFVMGIRLLSFFNEWYDDFIPYQNWLI